MIVFIIILTDHNVIDTLRLFYKQSLRNTVLETFFFKFVADTVKGVATDLKVGGPIVCERIGQFFLGPPPFCKDPHFLGGSFQNVGGS